MSGKAKRAISEPPQDIPACEYCTIYYENTLDTSPLFYLFFRTDNCKKVAWSRLNLEMISFNFVPRS